jgi:hypothetical protein
VKDILAASDLWHLAPYTSVVGPSGIGKSFSVAQMAKAHGLYVVYANFSPRGSKGYPKRSAIADRIPQFNDPLDELGKREKLTCFWESFIRIALMQVAICRTGASPIPTTSAPDD